MDALPLVLFWLMKTADRPTGPIGCQRACNGHAIVLRGKGVKPRLGVAVTPVRNSHPISAAPLSGSPRSLLLPF